MEKYSMSSFDSFSSMFDTKYQETSKMLRFVAILLCTIATVHCAKVVPPSPVHQAVDANNKPVAILLQDSAVNPDGSHYNVWESENGIKVKEEGIVKIYDDENIVHSVNGQVSYNDENGKPIVLTYVADENGYQPKGEHLPTVPPLPEAIARALEYIAAHPYVEKENPDVRNVQ